MKHILAAAATLAVLAPVAGHAQWAKPEDAIKYRQSAFSVMGTHFSRLGAMVNGRVPFDAKVAADNAALVATVSKLPGGAFPAGSDTGMNTKALPAIWKDTAKFTAAYENMMGAVAKLPAAAGSLDTLKPAFASAADSCKACHDDFRAK